MSASTGVSAAFGRLRGRRGLPRATRRAILNQSGRAGPRRPALIVAGAVAVAAVVGVVALSGDHAPTPSHDARRNAVDPLPGGLASTPEQDALAFKATDEQAHAALATGVSFTPQIAPSRKVNPPPPRVEQAVPQPAWSPAVPQAPQQAAKFVGRPVPAPPLASPRTVLPAAFELPAPTPAARSIVVPPVVVPRPPVINVAATSNTGADQVYSKQIADMFSQWGGRAPRTDVVMPPAPADIADPVDAPASRRETPPLTASARRAASPVLDASVEDKGRILIPAGRGIFAHPILALSSDSSSPVVMQADSGPIAGDRMIGTFAKQEDRLVIHISSVIHNGENIGVDGVVTSPDTMEAAVASNVDEHYVSRFILPAAAAFVAGLGNALATTSNTVAQVSPFGGVTQSTSLNFHQQLGVAAGAAAAQIGQTLNQSAPKGPTVELEANVSVGVMFLSNVTAHQGR